MSAASLISSLPSPFGGFAPFPNSIMIPFMGAQSAVLGYEFGLQYEMGKRTIKSMDNDMFNKIRSGSTDSITVVSDGKEIKMQYNNYLSFLAKRQWQEQITLFRENLPSAQSLQNDIITASVDIELKKANRTPSAMVEILHALMGASSKELKTLIDQLPAPLVHILFQMFPLLPVILNADVKLPEPPTEPKGREPEPPEPKTPTSKPPVPPPPQAPYKVLKLRHVRLNADNWNRQMGRPVTSAIKTNTIKITDEEYERLLRQSKQYVQGWIKQYNDTRNASFLSLINIQQWNTNQLKQEWSKANFLN